MTLALGGLAGLAILQVSCVPMYPGGLTEKEWNSLPPDRRAELRLQQEQVDAARQANVQAAMDRAERQREYENSFEPKVYLTPKQAGALNALTPEP